MAIRVDGDVVVSARWGPGWPGDDSRSIETRGTQQPPTAGGEEVWCTVGVANGRRSGNGVEG